MKRALSLLAAVVLTTLAASSQVVTERCYHLDKIQFLDQRQDFWRSHVLYSTASKPMSMISVGYYNLVEFHYGWGLASTSTPFSHHFVGASMVNGFRLGGGLAVGLGVGYYKYNDGWMLPVYLDGRYVFGKQKNKFFAMVSGGMLFNFEDFQANTRYFLNPGAGIIIPLAKGIQMAPSVGLFTQYDYDFFGRNVNIRDSFINLKIGFLFGK